MVGGRNDALPRLRSFDNGDFLFSFDTREAGSFISRLDSAGIQLWTRNLKYTLYDGVGVLTQDIDVTPQGEVVTQMQKGYSNLHRGYMTSKLDAAGNLLWSEIKDYGNVRLSELLPLANGQLMVYGRDNTDGMALTILLNAGGGHVDSRKYELPTGHYPFLSLELSNNERILGSYRSDPNGAQRFLRTDVNGTPIEVWEGNFSGIAMHYSLLPRLAGSKSFFLEKQFAKNEKIN